jgi:hypothetical protein
MQNCHGQRIPVALRVRPVLLHLQMGRRIRASSIIPLQGLDDRGSAGDT